jgi:hypothetical protein
LFFYVVLGSKFLGWIVRSDGFGLGIGCYILASLLRGDRISFLFICWLHIYAAST